MYISFYLTIVYKKHETQSSKTDVVVYLFTHHIYICYALVLPSSTVLLIIIQIYQTL